MSETALLTTDHYDREIANIKRTFFRMRVFLALIVSQYILAIVIGAVYKNDCEMGMSFSFTASVVDRKILEFALTPPLYLIAYGVIGSVVSVALIITTLTITKWTDPDYFGLFKFLVALGVILMITSTIYGSVIVFGMYSRWSSDILEWYTKETTMIYCNKTPFLLSFIILVFQVILIPIICFVITRIFTLIPQTNHLITQYKNMAEFNQINH